MVGILGTEGLNDMVSAIIERSRRHIIIISPFLKINQKLRGSIAVALKRGVKLTVVYGKTSLDSDTMDWLRSLPYCNIGYLQNLHAKLVMNEEAAVLSSLNLYEYSQVNNEELGMIAWMKDGKNEFKDLLYEAIRMINLSKKQYGPWDIEDVDEPLRSRFRKETFFIPVDHLDDVATEEEGTNERRICHCIRCGRAIPSEHPYPYCGRCLESWMAYRNPNYVEASGRCYICGKAYRTSATRPSCPECFRENADLVTAKAESMKKMTSSENRE